MNCVWCVEHFNVVEFGIFNFSALDEELDLILHQETLPEEVLSSLGMDPDNMKVLTPQQLIEVKTFKCQKCSQRASLKILDAY